MKPKGGYFGKILEVNLSTKSIQSREIPDETYRKFLGGTGLGAFFLWNMLPPKADPLAAENPILFALGPTNGTYCTFPRMSVIFKSPHTGIFGQSLVGGNFANEIKWAGWDAILVTGRSRLPVYLYIENDRVEIRDGRFLWGQDTYHTAQTLMTELKDRDLRVACIGPAGENKVPFACIVVDRFRAAGRTGGGCLMGDKKLKAIVVKGTQAVPVAQDQAYLKFTRALYREAAASSLTERLRRYGTAAGLERNNWVVGSLVTKNYQTTWYPGITRLGAEEAERRFWKRKVSCPNCPVHCMNLGVVRWGPYSGLVAEGPEYESGTMLGSNCQVSEIGGLLKAIEVCDALGLDNISMGNVLGFTMELIDRAILTPADLDNINLEWGDTAAMVELIERTAAKKGQAGQLLSLGVKRMAEKIGQDALSLAVQVKGNELAAHDPRGNKNMVYNYALGTRGGSHMEGGPPPSQVITGLFNSIILCSFGGSVFMAMSETPFADLLNPLCGWQMKNEEYLETGRRILTLIRCFNVREGISRKDDTLPPRLLTEKLPEGPQKGAGVTAEEMRKAQDEYYRFFGWDDDGIPTEKTLQRLGLEFAEAQIKPFRK